MNDLETLVLELIGENTTSPDVFTDTSTGMAQIRDSINDAIQEISMITGGYKKDYHLPLEANCGFYRLKWTEGNLGWITDAWLVGQKRRLEQTDLIRLCNFNPHWMKNQGPPESYFPIGFDIIGVWPRPSADTDIIAFTCAIIPERYTDETDRIKLRDNYSWAAVHYAVSEYYASRGDAKTATMHFNKYIQKIGMQKFYPLSAERKWIYKTDKEPWPTYTS